MNIIHQSPKIMYISWHHFLNAGNGQKNTHFKSVIFFLPRSNMVRKSRLHFLLHTAYCVQITWGKGITKRRGDFKLSKMILPSKT